ncbi:hypothetical protein DFH27DRAFT_639029 [Peziza echinospora]|nr:hypothetical protein DFH27DRAFT_639029 [Peziza echinospora]
MPRPRDFTESHQRSKIVQPVIVPRQSSTANSPPQPSHPVPVLESSVSTTSTMPSSSTDVHLQAATIESRATKALARFKGASLRIWADYIKENPSLASKSRFPIHPIDHLWAVSCTLFDILTSMKDDETIQGVLYNGAGSRVQEDAECTDERKRELAGLVEGPFMAGLRNKDRQLLDALKEYFKKRRNPTAGAGQTTGFGSENHAQDAAVPERKVESPDHVLALVAYASVKASSGKSPSKQQHTRLQQQHPRLVPQHPTTLASQNETSSQIEKDCTTINTTTAIYQFIKTASAPTIPSTKTTVTTESTSINPSSLTDTQTMSSVPHHHAPKKTSPLKHSEPAPESNAETKTPTTTSTKPGPSDAQGHYDSLRGRSGAGQSRRNRRTLAKRFAGLTVAESEAAHNTDGLTDIGAKGKEKAKEAEPNLPSTAANASEAKPAKSDAAKETNAQAKTKNAGKGTPAPKAQPEAKTEVPLIPLFIGQPPTAGQIAAQNCATCQSDDYVILNLPPPGLRNLRPHELQDPDLVAEYNETVRRHGNRFKYNRKNPPSEADILFELTLRQIAEEQIEELYDPDGNEYFARLLRQEARDNMYNRDCSLRTNLFGKLDDEWTKLEHEFEINDARIRAEMKRDSPSWKLVFNHQEKLLEISERMAKIRELGDKEKKILEDAQDALSIAYMKSATDDYFKDISKYMGKEELWAKTFNTSIDAQGFALIKVKRDEEQKSEYLYPSFEPVFPVVGKPGHFIKGQPVHYIKKAKPV